MSVLLNHNAVPKFVPSEIRADVSVMERPRARRVSTATTRTRRDAFSLGARDARDVSVLLSS